MDVMFSGILIFMFFCEIYCTSTFRGAVYEHAVIIPLERFPVSRELALFNMMRNLEIYKEQAELAGKQNVDIIVFPEDGIYGMGLGRKAIAPYLEFIPDPKQGVWNPCVNPNRYLNTDVQRFLSCLARNNSVYLVANFGDRQPCSRLSDPNCPSDGHYQYNTDIAYNPSGTLIAKYHKVNLFYESEFDVPKVSEAVTFKTPFGIFGMFTCFDILYYEPAIKLISDVGVRNIVFPTAWRDQLPLLAAIQFHSAFAIGNKINMLSANINFPLLKFHGSGIYTPTGPLSFSYSDKLARGALSIADIPILNTKQKESTYSYKVDNNTKLGRQDQHMESVQKLLSKDNKFIPSNMQLQLRTAASNESFRDNSSEEFQAYVFHDLFNFRLLAGDTGNFKVCHNSVCCELSYLRDNSSDLYALGAFDGLHTYQGSYYMQVCTVLKCSGQHYTTCGQAAHTASTNFKRIRLAGTFGSPYVYPEVLLTDKGSLRLPLLGGWSYKDGVLESFSQFKNPLLSFSMFSRKYDQKDTS